MNSAIVSLSKWTVNIFTVNFNELVIVGKVSRSLYMTSGDSDQHQLELQAWLSKTGTVNA